MGFLGVGWGIRAGIGVIIKSIIGGEGEMRGGGRWGNGGRVGVDGVSVCCDLIARSCAWCCGINHHQLEYEL